MLFLVPSSLANDQVDVHVFYGEGCAHCNIMMDYLDELRVYYPMNITIHEVYFNETNRDLFKKFSFVYSSKLPVIPSIFIDDELFFGSDFETRNKINETLKYCSENLCVNPLDKTIQYSNLGIGIGSSPYYSPIIFLPVIILFFSIFFAFNNSKVRTSIKKKRLTIHLIADIILFLIAILTFIGIGYGIF